MGHIENKEQLFGTKAIISGEDTSSFSVLLKTFLKLQPIKFWVIAFIVSFLINHFFTFGLYLPYFFNKVNIFLFPFAVMLVGKISILGYPTIPMIRELLYPSYKVNLESSHLIITVITLLIKSIIYIIVWNYTFIIGVLGLIMALDDVKKLSK